MEAESPLALHELVRRILPASGKQQHSERGTGVLGEKYEVVATDELTTQPLELNTDYKISVENDSNAENPNVTPTFRRNTRTITPKHCMTTIMFVSTKDAQYPLWLFVDGVRFPLEFQQSTNRGTNLCRVRLPRFHQVEAAATSYQNVNYTAAPVATCFRVLEGAWVPAKVVVQMLQRVVVRRGLLPLATARPDGWTVVRSSLVDPHSSGAVSAAHVANSYPMIATEQPSIEILDYSSVRAAVQRLYATMSGTDRNAREKSQAYRTFCIQNSSGGTILFGSKDLKDLIKYAFFPYIRKNHPNLINAATYTIRFGSLLVKNAYKTAKRNERFMNNVLREAFNVARDLGSEIPVRSVLHRLLTYGAKWHTQYEKELEDKALRSVTDASKTAQTTFSAFIEALEKEADDQNVKSKRIPLPSNIGKAHKIHLRDLASDFKAIGSALRAHEGVPELTESKKKGAALLLTWLEWPAEPGTSTEWPVDEYYEREENESFALPEAPLEEDSSAAKEEWWNQTCSTIRLFLGTDFKNAAQTKYRYDDVMKSNGDEYPRLLPRLQNAFPNRIVSDAFDPLFLGQSRVESALSVAIHHADDEPTKECLFIPSASSATDAFLISLQCKEHYEDARAAFVELCSNILGDLKAIIYCRRELFVTDKEERERVLQRQSAAVFGLLNEPAINSAGRKGEFQDLGFPNEIAPIQDKDDRFGDCSRGANVGSWLRNDVPGFMGNSFASMTYTEVMVPAIASLLGVAAWEGYRRKILPRAALSSIRAVVALYGENETARVEREVQGSVEIAQKTWAYKSIKGDISEMDYIINCMAEESDQTRYESMLNKFEENPLEFLFTFDKENDYNVGLPDYTDAQSFFETAASSPLFSDIKEDFKTKWGDNFFVTKKFRKRQLEVMDSIEKGVMAVSNHIPRIHYWVMRAETELFSTSALVDNAVDIVSTVDKEKRPIIREDLPGSQNKLCYNQRKRNELPKRRLVPEEISLKDEEEQAMQTQLGLCLQELKFDGITDANVRRYIDAYNPWPLDRKNWRLAALIVPTEKKSEDSFACVRLSQIVSFDVGQREDNGLLKVSLQYEHLNVDLLEKAMPFIDLKRGQTVVLEKQLFAACSDFKKAAAHTTALFQRILWNVEYSTKNGVHMVLYPENTDKMRVIKTNIEYQSPLALSLSTLSGNAIPQCISRLNSLENSLQESVDVQKRAQVSGMQRMGGDAVFLKEHGLPFQPVCWSCIVAFYDVVCVLEVLRRIPGACPWLLNVPSLVAASRVAGEALHVLKTAFSKKSHLNAALSCHHAYFRRSRNGGLVLLLLNSCPELTKIIYSTENSQNVEWPDKIGRMQLELFERALSALAIPQTANLKVVPLAPLQSMPFYANSIAKMSPKFTAAPAERLCFEGAASFLELCRTILLQVENMLDVSQLRLLLQALLSRPFVLQLIVSASSAIAGSVVTEDELNAMMRQKGQEALQRQKSWPLPKPLRVPPFLWRRTRRFCTSDVYLDADMASLSLTAVQNSIDLLPFGHKWDVPFCAFSDVLSSDSFASSAVEDCVVYLEHVMQTCNSLLLLMQNTGDAERRTPFRFRSSFPTQSYRTITFPASENDAGSVYLPPFCPDSADRNEPTRVSSVKGFDSRFLVTQLWERREKWSNLFSETQGTSETHRRVLWNTDRMIQILVLMHTVCPSKQKAGFLLPSQHGDEEYNQCNAKLLHISLILALSCCMAVFPLSCTLQVEIAAASPTLREVKNLVESVQTFASQLCGRSQEAGSVSYPVVKAAPLHILCAALISLGQ